MKNCTLEMAYILVERGLPFLPGDCQGRLPVAWVKYDILTSWAGGIVEKHYRWTKGEEIQEDVEEYIRIWN